MVNEVREPLNFGPSERYLPGKKLNVGDVLTMNIVDYEPEQVDTEWGSKWELHINLLSSSSDEATPGLQIWRTVAHAPEQLIKYLKENDVPGEDYERWVFKLTIEETGSRLEEIA